MTLAEQLATLLEQGWDQPRHRVVAATELRRLRAELAVERERCESLRQALLKCKTCALPTEVRDLVNAALTARKEAS